MISKILSAILLIPDLLQELRQFRTAIKKFYDNKFFDDLSRVREVLEKPSTPEEKADAAKRVADLIHRL